MFDHIGIGVSDLKASKDFFLEALSPLGVAVIMEFPHAAGLGRAQKPFLWLGATQGNPLPLHIPFPADNRTQVDQFYRCAIAAVAQTMARQAFELIITRTTMLRLSSVQMGTTSR